LETQLRHASAGDKWSDTMGQTDDEQLRKVQREKAELRAKMDALHEKVI